MSGTAWALDANQAEQDIGYEVESYGVIAISADVSGLTIEAPTTPGGVPADATSTDTTYSYSTNKTAQVITAQLDLAMETGLALKLTMGTPTGDNAAGTTAGEKTLSNESAATMVTGVAREGTGTLSYTLSATTAAAADGVKSKTVTFTIKDA
jgi:hypothetical protein